MSTTPTPRPLELTTRGWALAGAVVGLYTAGRVLGTVELAMLAGGGVAALVAAAVAVHLNRPAVTARRSIIPARLHAGSPARAEIVVTNRGRRRTPLLAVTDGFSGRREARFGVAPVGPGETARGAYRIPTSRRGVYTVGPLTVAVTDPLGLVRRPLSRGPQEQVTVYPRVEPVTALPPAAGRDLVGGSMPEFVQARVGEEFRSLREYVVGDDLRHVHWRSTARTGELMIREHDVPWQLRVTLLLDNRAAAHPAATFESAVEATASVATALHGAGALLRLILTDGTEVPFGGGADHFDALMERLALVGVTLDGHLGEVADRLLRQPASGALVIVTGPVGGNDRARLLTLAARFGSGVLVRFGAPDPAVVRSPVLVVVDVPDRQGFAAAWNARLGRGRRPVTGRR